MSDNPQKDAQAIVQQADALIAQIKRQLDEPARQLGLDPSKVDAFAERNLTAEHRRKVDEQLKRDLEEVEEEVAQARLRMNPGDSSARPKRPRNTV